MNEFARSLSNVMTPLYVEKFKLSFAPFSDRYSESLYFEDDSRSEILKKITHLTDYTNLVLFIQGAEGLGKTSILKHRLNIGKSNWRICYFNAKDYVHSEAFIEKLFTDFQLNVNEDLYTAEPKSLHAQINNLRQSGLTPVVIIDDVDEINKSIIPTLQSLIQYDDETGPVVRLIIAGEDLPSHLEEALPVDSKFNSIKYLPVPPLSERQTSNYIRFRLSQAGYTGVEPFNKQKLKNIYLDSKGFPKYINHLSDHLMGQYVQSAGDRKHRMPINESTGKGLKLAAGVLGIVVLITLVVVLFDKETDQTPDLVQEEGVKQIEIPKQTVKSELAKSAKTELDTSSTTINETPKNKNGEKESPPIPTRNISTTEAKKQIPKKQLAEEKVTAPKVEPVAKVTTVAAFESSDKSWITQQNPKHYTLQLIGSSNKKAAQNFIKKHNIEKNAHFFHTVRKGKDWYSVVYNSYPTLTDAKKATKKLPSSLKKIKPWIRPFKDIQKAAN